MLFFVIFYYLYILFIDVGTYDLEARKVGLPLITLYYLVTIKFTVINLLPSYLGFIQA